MKTIMGQIMKFKVLCVGKIKDGFYRDEIAEICDEIKKKGHSMEIIEFPDEKIPDNLKEKNKEAFIEKECNRMFEKITGKDYVVALCIEGKEMNSKKHKEYIEKAKENGFDQIIYVIGGSLGLPEKMKQRANLKLSFSKMTFPHQMMRMVLCEEIKNVL